MCEPHRVPVPDHLRAFWRHTPVAEPWLEALPATVSACADRWALTLGEPFRAGNVAWVAPVTRADGSPAVLKVNFPEPESEPEGDALAFWDRRGAVGLIDQDRDRRALLIDRCLPGDPLWSVEDEAAADAITATVLATLWRPAPADGPFRTLTDDARDWAAGLPGRWRRHREPFPRRLLEEALTLVDELSARPPAPVLCHQDAHGGNLLAGAAGWVAIDPKPLIGERAFDLASPLRDRLPALLSAPDPRRRLSRRLDFYVDRFGLDRARVRGWALVHSLAWGLTDTETFPDQIAAAALFAQL
ncbi:aminoglycoside phosphotransferase family protein [Conexibacter sp. DBS9H8]|uniref:aminoglycoside phosphotransferase family protein n=1 Tax=Conexibacter sp. DBS9H8 TaxID=2937801 RepID=UPI002010B4C1|nr:aminoglycoside phosphotransferase family protein [Conexibacter sp. DBS9H8]